MKTLVLTNQKGGVGKSALARLIAHYAASQGQRILCIDLDQQGNFTYPLKLSGKAEVAPTGASTLLTESKVKIQSSPMTLVPSDGDLLLNLEKMASLRNNYATNFRTFILDHDDDFDICIVDTNPNPDIRLLSALCSADYALSPIQLNQEAISGIGGVVKHPIFGTLKIQATVNKNLSFLGIVPMMVELTSPFQVENFKDIVKHYGHLLIPLSKKKGSYAFIPKRSIIAESQASGEVLWEMEKGTARQVWKEIKPSIAAIYDKMMQME